MKNFVLFICLFFSLCSFSQVSDNFSGSDFLQFPAWDGDVEKFTINSDFQLQLDAPKDGSPAQLFLASQRVLNTSWECWLKMDFNPTSANYVKIYLCSNSSDLKSDLNGLFIRVGYTKKQVSLLSQAGKTTKVLIQGEEMRLDSSNVALRIKAVLEKSGNLSLYSKFDDEPDFVLEGNYILENLPQSNYFGIVCVFSATRRNLFFFDDFKINPLSDEDDDKEVSGTGNDHVKVKSDLLAGSYSIEYSFPTYDNRCRMMVFDSMGRMIDMPYNNIMLGAEGSLLWNGKDKSGHLLRRGIYIIYMEVNQSDGKVLKYKLPVIVR